MSERHVFLDFFPREAEFEGCRVLEAPAFHTSGDHPMTDRRPPSPEDVGCWLLQLLAINETQHKT